MNCREVLEILRDGRPVEGSAASHVDACPSCAREFGLWRDVRATLRAPVTPPPFLHARIMAGVRAEVRARAEQGPWYAAIWVRRWAIPSLAATVLFIGQGAGLTALFRPVPDDLVVRWSEEQAFLLAQNATPVRADPEIRDLRPSQPKAPPQAVPRQNLAEDPDGILPSPSLPDFAPEPPSPAGAAAPSVLSSAEGRRSDQPGSPPSMELAQIREREEAPAPAATEGSSLRGELDSTGHFALESKKEKGGSLRSQNERAAPSLEAPGKSRIPQSPASVAPAKRSERTIISCRVEREGSLVARVEIPASAAPSAGEPFIVKVDASGHAASVGPSPVSRACVSALNEALSPLGLPEGTYTLSR